MWGNLLDERQGSQNAHMHCGFDKFIEKKFFMNLTT